MLKTLMYVSIGSIAVILPIMLVVYWYGIKIWKIFPIIVYAAITGTISTYLWFVIENQRFAGISFFGAVFLIPVAFLCATKLFRESFEDLMDICAVGICMMLAVMKVQCLMSRCCGGRALFQKANGVIVRFPSQIAELANGLILCMILLILAYKFKFRGKLYPIFLILYGITRFILNFFRDVWGTGEIPYGTIWSILSVIIGIVWLVRIKKDKQKLIKEDLQ